MRAIAKLGLYFATAVVGLAYGMAAMRFELPPYSLVKQISAVVTQDDERRRSGFTNIRLEYLQTDVAELISIKRPQDALRLRNELIAVLFGDSGLPNAQPTRVVKGVVDEHYSDIDSLLRVDELVATMDYGIESRAYHFVPRNPKNEVVLYHQGHAGGFDLGKHTIERFLDQGYAVLAYSMPLLGLNNQPIVKLPRQGNLKLTAHHHIKFLVPENGHPIRYFIEPVVIGLNYLEREFSYTSIAMVGISGGGWTTTLASAIDTRINTSIPVAGSYPVYLRSNEPRDWGDYEQIEPAIYQTANYLELYILGSFGPDRAQLQVVNRVSSPPADRDSSIFPAFKCSQDRRAATI